MNIRDLGGLFNLSSPLASPRERRKNTREESAAMVVVTRRAPEKGVLKTASGQGTDSAKKQHLEKKVFILST